MEKINIDKDHWSIVNFWGLGLRLLSESQLTGITQLPGRWFELEANSYLSICFATLLSQTS